MIENMFLFAEQNTLAIKANKYGFQPYYYAGIKNDHQEDGNMSLAETNINGEFTKSNMYLYEQYI